MTARTIIERLGLTPHPEGGWYRETVRRSAADGGRDVLTAIYFLLDQGGRSHWHRVDAEEMWLWHAGSPLTLRIAGPGGTTPHRLGGDVLAGQLPQVTVPAGRWQSADAPDGWALVSRVVVLAFDFAGFELAPEGWMPD